MGNFSREFIENGGYGADFDTAIAEVDREVLLRWSLRCAAYGFFAALVITALMVVWLT
jgi:hypothetical protein